MSNSKRGRMALRPLSGQRATGVCLHTVSNGRLEATVSAQTTANGASLTALLQYGPMGGYRCLPAQPLDQPLEAKGPLPAAVWVLDRGNPVLLGQFGAGPFDVDVAKARLLQPVEAEGVLHVHPADQENGGASALPAELFAVPPAPPPDTSVPDDAVEAARDLPAEKPPEVPEDNLPAVNPPDQEAYTPDEAPNANEAGGQPPLAAAEETMPFDGSADSVEAIALEPAVDPAWESPATEADGWATPAAEPPQAVDGMPRPLVIERAPRPGPMTPVYSPLWDDVSAEFERMLEALPAARPFHSRADEDVQFAQLPLGGAVQCYIGSVVIEGRHVFLQAVPSRPYGRPAGFDHTLVARDGSCYWVKYFIEDA